MRVAIVNDLSLAREVLRRVVLSAPEHSLAWMAENGQEAIDKAIQDQPDVILMDLVMPEVDGVEATRRIMAVRPCPILLVTSSVASNFSKVFQALSHGGLDAVNTPTLRPDGSIQGREDILQRLDRLNKGLQQTSVRPPCLPCCKPAAAAPSVATVGLTPLLALGASTGGPECLARVLGALPSDFPAAVLVVQHIASEYAAGLAQWLRQHTTLPVQLAQDGEGVQAGVVYLAQTNDHLVVDAQRRLRYTVEPAGYPYRPSVDALFASLAAHWPRPGVAVLLTGMGSDGAQGLCRLRQLGWYTLAQNEATSVVYSMPRAAIEQGAVCEVLPLSQIAPAVLTHIWKITQGRSR